MLNSIRGFGSRIGATDKAWEEKRVGNLISQAVRLFYFILDNKEWKTVVFVTSEVKPIIYLREIFLLYDTLISDLLSDVDQWIFFLYISI